MGVDYDFLGCIGWRVEYRSIVEWCQKNDCAFSTDEPYFDEVRPAVEKLLRINAAESGHWAYEGGIDSALFCLCVNEPFAGHAPYDFDADYLRLKAASQANWADYDPDNPENEHRGIEDQDLHNALMKKWGPQLKAVQSRALKLGLQLPEPTIFLDVLLT